MCTHINLNGIEVSTEYLDERLAGLLADVWGSLPELDRDKIAHYWNSNRAILNKPIFALTDEPPDNVGPASASFHGFLLRFHRASVVNNDDDSVKRLIAHEIGHVYDYAVQATKCDIDDGTVVINGIGIAKCDPCYYEVSLHDDPLGKVRDEYSNGKMNEWGYEPLQ